MPSGGETAHLDRILHDATFMLQGSAPHFLILTSIKKMGYASEV